MTKTVRIENADNSNYRVAVDVFDRSTEGPDTLVKTVRLDYPTAMTTDLYLTSSRYFIVREEHPLQSPPTRNG